MEKYRKISLFAMILWLVIGTAVLCGDRISHVAYFICWFALMLHEIFNLVCTCLASDDCEEDEIDD